MGTARTARFVSSWRLWFAFILVTLHYWEQLLNITNYDDLVVICFHFSNFALLGTAASQAKERFVLLWFAFILVTLHYWEQLRVNLSNLHSVVICFHFSNFALLGTASRWISREVCLLWFAFILVTLHYWEQLFHRWFLSQLRCDLLSF